MGNQWIQAVARNISAKSRSKDVAEALKEWFYTGSCFDQEEPCEVCKLCDHQGIRYQFEIQNQHTYHALLIGSECITHFNLEGVVGGFHLGAKETTERVHTDRRKLIADARKQRIVECLLLLGQKEQDPAFDYDCANFITYLQDRRAFTPKQLAFPFWRMRENAIEYTPQDFTLVMRKQREKDQLMNMEAFKLEKLFPVMTASQQKWVRNKRGV